MERIRKTSKRTLATKEAVRRMSRPVAIPWSRTDIFDFLSMLGIDVDTLTRTSIPDKSLLFACHTLEEHIRAGPVFGLHVGNFAGVSLCHFTNFVRQLDEGSTIVSIDPNVPHAGIRRPMDFVISCLNRYGLQANSLVLTGYSLEKNIWSDAMPNVDYGPVAEFSKAESCEHQLAQLVMILPPTFDFAVIDGNHEENYLVREIEAIDRLLKPGGLLVLDDVEWDQFGKVYREIDRARYHDLGNDGRVGVLKKVG
jgi:hypothetical protein